MPDDLVTLPHSGLRVPNPDLHVTSAQTMPGSDGWMLNATLRLRTRIVGYVIDKGDGGPTFYQPSGTSFGWRELATYVAACRNPAGAPVSEETVLNVLVDEYTTGRAITAATRGNQTLVRLCTAWDGLTYAKGTAHATRVTTAAHRTRLLTGLADSHTIEPDDWWQMWTGTGWDDLSHPPAPAHA